MQTAEKITQLKEKAKKDISAILDECKQKKMHVLYAYTKQRIYRSTIFSEKISNIENIYKDKLEERKQKLEEDIKKLEEIKDDTPDTPPFPEGYKPPYPVDLSLTFEERYRSLCKFYSKYPNKQIALEEIKNDIYIQSYLGFYYTFLCQFIQSTLP